MTTEEKYVAAAYLVVFVVVLVYLVIMASKLSRLSQEVGELAQRLREEEASAEPEPSDHPRREEVEVG